MIAIDLFLTLDGVGQAPGGPGEDPTGGFRFEGWQAPVADEVVGSTTLHRLLDVDALLLGRRTYDIFADYWPQHIDNPIGELFDRIPKYVASRSRLDLRWKGATQLGPDLVSAVRALGVRHERVHVIGSLDLVQTLFAERLYDELALWIHPVVLGEGKEAFPHGALPTNLRLTEQPVVSPSGAVLLRYAPDGDPGTGTVAPD